MERGSKETIWILQGSKGENLMQEGINMATKGKPFKIKESLQIAAENNAIRTNYISSKIDNT